MFGHIIEEVHCLRSSLYSSNFKHVKRLGRVTIKLAHALARQAVLFADTTVWVDDLPSDLNNVF